MYAFGSKTPTGFADITRHFQQNNNILQQITFVGKVKSFSHNYFDATPFNSANNTTLSSFNLNYYKLSANLDFELKKKYHRSHTTQHVGYTSTNLFFDKVRYIITLVHRHI